MKVQNFFRTQVIALGFGAALLFAGAAHAQEIDNPTFDQGANSVPMPYGQNDSANATHGNASAAALKTNAAEAEVASASAVVQTSVLGDETSLRGMSLGMLAIGLAWAALYLNAKKNERDGEGRLQPEVRYLSKVYSLK